jgi:hypothetical protein
VQRSKEFNTKLYNGKYKCHCFKAQVIIDAETKIIEKAMIFNGHMHDIPSCKIVIENSNYKNIKLLGDKGYCGIKNIITPIKKSAFKKLNYLQKDFNKRLSMKRASIERVFSQLKMFAFLGGVFRGTKEKLNQWFNIIIDIYNYNLIQKMQVHFFRK